MDRVSDGDYPEAVNNLDFLIGQTVQQIWVWGSVRLVFDEPDLTTYADFEGPAVLRKSEESIPVNFWADGDRRESAAVLELLWAKVEAAHIEEDSVLKLSFDNGMELRGEPSAEGESWCVCGEGRTVFCLPGGGIERTGRWLD